MGQLKKSDYKANMKAVFRRKLYKYQNKTALKLRNISNRFSMRQRILLSDRFIDEATGEIFAVTAILGEQVGGTITMPNVPDLI